MALQGNLRDFPITQLLNLIHLARKTGTLVVEAADESIQISFREGKLAFARLGHDDEDLVSLLQKVRKLSASQIKALQGRIGQQTDKELGLLLINASYLTQQEILSTLQSQYTGVVRRLFSWVEGAFRFENEIPPPEDKILLRIGLENIILESSRRLQEAAQLQEEIPNLDVVLKFAERPGTNLRNLNLSIDEWRVVSFINAKNSIRQIGRAAQVSDLEIRRIIYGLLQAGLVETTAPPYNPLVSGAQPARGAHTAPQIGPERRSLINRLITRIRSI